MAETADFSKSNFLGATLGFARLGGANLSDCDLTDANLSHADLSGCNLSGATLTRTKLIDAELIGAKLFGTYPWQATFYPQDETLSGKQEAATKALSNGFQTSWIRLQTWVPMYRSTFAESRLVGYL